MPESITKSRAALWTCLLLALVTLAVYWPVFHCEFVDYDDDTYITGNRHVQSGLTWESLRWAFTTRYASNWHPLTWISHMLDCQFYGLNPGGHHATNVVLHLLNSVLLFAVLRRMTGTQWRSAFVAALFALHPLHVESVAWVAERKDVVSTFLGLLALMMYAPYVELSKVQSPKSKVFYGLALLFFTLALMAKPMLVTLPFVLLLLDFWPLRRMPATMRFFGREIGTPKPSGGKANYRATLARLVAEKLPLLVLSCSCCVITVWAQTIAMRGLENVNVTSRISNAVVSYCRYVNKMVWPAGLAVLYPFPQTVSIGHLTMATVALACLSYLAIRCAKRRPYLVTGWFWFLGTLVPVIGLVQVGLQSMADRYTYVPLIGLFIIIAWGGYDLARRWQLRPAALVPIAVLPILACIPVTRAQLGYWRNSVVLFEHALRRTSENFFMEYDLAKVFMKMGKLDDARQHMAEATKILPSEPETHLGLGMVLMEQKKFTEAAEQLTIVLQLKTNYWKAHAMLGAALIEQGKPEDALRHFSEAVRMDPTNAEIRSYWAMALDRLGRVQDAVTEYREALKLDPQIPGVLNNLAWILASNPNPGVRNGKEAVRLAEQACRLNGYRDPELVSTLGAAYAEAGRFEEAVDTANRAEAMATAVGNMKLAEENKQRTELFRSRKALHEASETVTNSAAANP
jgi:tetratricopeptide (TPR) repeat protein